ncbi:MAG: metallophosphoesterase [Thermoflavifilum sp.]|nr:metallophosphoesterase [Thermoflavifilum sp.]
MFSIFRTGWILLILLVIDWYAFQAVRTLTHEWQTRARLAIYLVYAVFSLAGYVFLFFSGSWHIPAHQRMTGYTIFIGAILGKLLVDVWLLLDDIRRGIAWLARLWAPRGEVSDAMRDATISRSQFLSATGLIVGGLLYGSLLYGMSNKYRYRVHHIKIYHPELPEAFRGLRVVQISDIHAGSFTRPDRVARGVAMAMELKPDIIFFTGDLINNHHEEMDGYQEIFARLQAPMGVFAILGNHDYGDYTHWPSPEAKAANLARLKEIEAEMGWQMLNNAHTVLERGGQQIALIGVENWSALRHFSRYGDLKKAYAGTESFPFKILLSHDPTHWDAQVRPEFPDIQLTLSGHTHGFQFGVEIPGFKWSPCEYVYKEWAGLYREGRQYLYVNRGYGFIGYPGRVGILPEITLLELL